MLDIEHFNAAHQNLRVAVVSETWPPEINGVAATMHRLAIELRQQGHAIQVIRPRQPADAVQGAHDKPFDETLTRGLPIPAYPHLRMGLPAKRLLTNMWGQHRPDIIHVATEGPLGWSAMQAARTLKIPVSSDFRTNFHQYSRHYGAGRFTEIVATYLRKFHNLTHFTTVPTDKLRRELEALGFERLRVLSRGIDVNRFSPEHRSDCLRNQWGVALDDRVYLYVGRLAPEKNPGLLARAWKVISSRDERARLVIVGDGPAAAMYRQSLPQAVFVGPQMGHELAVHYASADVFLFPSTTETYGNVVPEAMASGLMGLTFDYAASSELVVHDHNGWIASYASEAHYLTLAGELALMPAEQLSHQRQQARATMQSRGWDVIGQQIEQWWRDQITSQPHWLNAQLPSGSALPLT